MIESEGFHEYPHIPGLGGWTVAIFGAPKFPQPYCGYRRCAPEGGGEREEQAVFWRTRILWTKTERGRVGVSIVNRPLTVVSTSYIDGTTTGTVEGFDSGVKPVQLLLSGLSSDNLQGRSASIGGLDLVDSIWMMKVEGASPYSCGLRAAEQLCLRRTSQLTFTACIHIGCIPFAPYHRRG